ncbi:MAG: BMP family ABC transporter substrate-binding protein [Vulcanimicrobiaceae bacterium]
MRFQRASVVACALALALAACTKSTGPAAPSEGDAKVPGGTSPLRLALVTDARGLGDTSTNDAAYAGLVEAKARLGARIEVLQSKSAADYRPNLTLLANEEFDEIFAVGPAMRGDLEAIARLYPRRRFAIVDAVVDQANVTSIVFRDEDAAFLAGALAAMMSKTKTIGFLGGVDIPLLRKFEAGFAAGAREIDPSVALLERYVGSSDVAAGGARAAALYDAGADIVFVAAGRAGIGAIERTRSRRGVYAIGAGADRDGLAPGRVLTSVVERADVAVLRVAQESQSLKVTSGTIELGLDGGVGLTDFAYTRAAIGRARLARLERLRRAILARRIVPPATRAELATFRAVAL